MKPAVRHLKSSGAGVDVQPTVTMHGMMSFYALHYALSHDMPLQS